MDSLVIIILGGAIIFGGLLLFIISKGAPKKRKEHMMHSGHIQTKWNSLQAARHSKNIASLRHAVITADKLVDHALKNIGTPGSTLGERAKNATVALGDTKDKFWDAHRTRNRLVHEVTTEVRAHEAQSALDKYEEVLKQLGVV